MHKNAREITSFLDNSPLLLYMNLNLSLLFVLESSNHVMCVKIKSVT